MKQLPVAPFAAAYKNRYINKEKMHNPITLIVKDRRGNTLDLFDLIPAADKQQIHLNFWTYSYDAPGWHKAQPQHISVESFSYTPSGVTPKAPLQHELRQLLDPGEPLLKNDAEPSRPAVPEPPPQYSTHASALTPLPEDEALRAAGMW